MTICPNIKVKCEGAEVESDGRLICIINKKECVFYVFNKDD